MFKRIIYSVTKHRLLNLLFIVFMIMSFVGIGVSNYYVMKTNKYMNEVYEYENYITYEDYDILGDSYEIVDFDDDAKVYEDMFDISNLALERGLDSRKSVYAGGLDFVEIQASDMYKIDFESMDELSYNITIDEMFFLDFYTLPEDYDRTKIYVDEIFAFDNDLEVGDVLTLASLDEDAYYDQMYMSSDSDVEYSDYLTEIQEVEIGAILAPDEDKVNLIFDEYGEYTDFRMVYIPIELASSQGIDKLNIYGISVVVTGNEKDIEQFYYDTSEYSNSIYVYYGKNVLDKEMEFFKTMNKFFIAILVLSIVLFTVSFASLNNNIFEKRKDELQLYSVFGIEIKYIGVQMVIERLVIFVISLGIAIPALLYFLRVSKNVVNTLVEYTLTETYNLLVWLSLVGASIETQITVEGGLAKIELNMLIVIGLPILIMLAIAILVSVIQFNINKKIIVNQRRGE